MNAQDITPKILEDTFSLSQLKRRVNLLKQVTSKKVFGGDNPNLEEYAQREDFAWLNSLTDDFYGAFNKENFTTTFLELEKYISWIKPLVVHLPFDLPTDEIKKLGTYLRKNFASVMVMDIKIDPSLIGGCALVWNGIYKDYSIRKVLEENKVEIITKVRKFL